MPMLDLRKQAKRRSTAALVKHLNSFSLDLRFSAGVWFFSPGGGRFHDAYVEKMSMEEILEAAAGLKKYGLCGLEAHYPNEVNEDNLEMFLDFERATGIRLITLVPNLFYDSQFEWGALSSPVRRARRAAIERTVTTLKLNKRLKTDFAIVWPGIDGYENPFGMNMTAYRDRFCEGLAEAMDAVPGVRVAEEPKPYEPRGRIIYGTTAEGILMAQKVESLLQHPRNK
ncbi:MAG: xylose isomerase, partial [Armatimonadota bacterium]